MTKMSETQQDRSADGVPEVEQEPCCRNMVKDMDRIVCDCDAGRGPEFKVRHGGACQHLKHLRKDHAATVPSAFMQTFETTGVPIAPAEQRTGVSDVQASSADEVAALRARIERTMRDVGLPTASAMATIQPYLDRIAALVPQRATGIQGRPMYQHDCGFVDAPPHDTPNRCANCGRPGPWRALYTVAGR